MKENTTVVYENKEKNKKTHYFTFDYSFWSHDEFRVCSDGYMEPITEKYIDQNRIYNIIGKEILQDAWYHSVDTGMATTAASLPMAKREQESPIP